MSRRGRHSRRIGSTRATIDMNSLIDLTFLLLVTFILTLTQMQEKQKFEQSSVRLNLPQAKKEEQEPEEEKKPLTVSIDKDNKIYLDDVQLGGINDALDKLKDTLREHVALDPDVAVFVRGDKEVKYDEVMKVVNAVHESRVQRVALRTLEE